jgi:hypothetical protein
VTGAQPKDAGQLVLDAEALYRELLRGVQQCARRNDARLVGITSGGAWLAERLQKDLGLPGSAGRAFRRPCTATTSPSAAWPPPRSRPSWTLT